MDRSPHYRSATRSRTTSRSPNSSPHRWNKSSRTPSPNRRKDSPSRSRSRTRSHSRSNSLKRHRSRSGSSRNGYDSGKKRRSRSPMSSRRRHVGTRDDPSPSPCLGVFGLSGYTTERQLEEIFDKYGSIEKVQVVLDAKTGKSRGFAFVYFEQTKAAKNAKEDCTGMEIDGRRIRVDYSITQRPHTPTPGIYMGRPTLTGRRNNNDRGYGGRSNNNRDRYRSPSPKYRQHMGSGRRDFYGDRGNDRGGYDRSFDRYEKNDRFDKSYNDRSYNDRSYNDRYNDRSDRSRSRSFSPRRYRY